ncbi:MAG: hypothetical protein NT009_14485 [Proteobacteria bacterium]|nr:hypothetical protein [Pseudomonadota bacterium]
MKTNVDVKVKVKRKYKFEGEEYGSIEDLPAEGQAAFKKAVPSGSERVQQSDPKAGQTKIVYKGQEYDLNDLPPIVRKVYEKLMEKSQKETGAPEDSTPLEIGDLPEPTADIQAEEMSTEPINPTATSPAARFVLILLALGAIIFLFYFLRR